ncbi:MAG TPA: MFS transporter [Candidatus Peribacteraceae bacterium]|nr:MFS transporter [Candidatus Peribacteraceae bacterium]
MQNLHRLILAKFLSSLYFSVPIQTLFFFAKGLTFTEIMLLESLLLIGIMLFEVPTGILGDRIGRKWSIVCGVIVGLLAWIPWFLADGFALFGLSFFLSGIAIAFQSGSDQALIYDDLKSRGEEANVQRIMGRYFGSMTFGTAVAALIGGYLAASQRLDIFYDLYKLNVVVQFLGLLVLLTVKEPKRTATGEERAHGPETSFTLFKEGVRRLSSHAKLRRIALLSLFTMPFSFVLIYIFQPYFLSAGVPATWYGVAVFIASLLSINAKIFAHKIEQWFGVSRGALLVTLLPAVFWFLMAMVFHPVYSVLLYILNDASGNVRDPIFSDYLNRHIESHNRATVLSTISLLGSLYAVIVRPIIGLVADIDIRYGFMMMGLIIVIGALYFRISDEHVKY